MDWNQPIDMYCERLDASFWAEPVNALSNIAFLVAAFFAYRLYIASKTKKTPKEIPLLIFMMGVIGVGSFLFHSFANQWSILADVLPILLFQILALWVFLRRFLHYSGLLCGALIVLFVAVSQGLSTYVPADFLNGSAGYLPSLAAQFMLAYALHRIYPKASTDMKNAAGIFLCSLTLRSFDMAVCDSVSTGTHFLWHFLNALTLYTVIKASCSLGKITAARRPRNTSRARS